MAQVTGPRAAVGAALDRADLGDLADLDRLGPLPFRSARPLGDGAEPGAALVQVLLRVPRSEHPVLARHLAAMRAGRSARKETDPLTVRMDLADEPG
jgi:primosomal protein N' (replication factor Y)